MAYNLKARVSRERRGEGELVRFAGFVNRQHTRIGTRRGKLPIARGYRNLNHAKVFV